MREQDKATLALRQRLARPIHQRPAHAAAVGAYVAAAVGAHVAAVGTGAPGICCEVQQRARTEVYAQPYICRFMGLSVR